MFDTTLAWLRENHWRFAPMNLLEKLARNSFDRRHGVDTQLDVQLAALDIDSPNKRRGKRYHATPPLSFKRILHRLAIDFADYSFIDIGSGKGRTLLLAAHFPFRQIIGVEFGAQLHAQALRNLQHYRAPYAARATSVHMDATAFQFPEGNLVIYLFNPFDGVVLQQVLANIALAASQDGRRVLIVYLYLENADVFGACTQFVPLFRWHRFDVFSYQHAPAPQNARALVQPV